MRMNDPIFLIGDGVFCFSAYYPRGDKIIGKKSATGEDYGRNGHV